MPDPGRRALTDDLEPRPSRGRPAPLPDGSPSDVQRSEPAGVTLQGILERRVQRSRDGAAAQAPAAPDPSAVHTAAEQGIAGPASSLPHLEQIQRSFGHHDVSHVQAHVGGPAAAGAQAMGAEAYATGHHVAFAEAPSLHLAAHEAAHTVQQQGGVQLAGGVGAAGDVYEQHADAVADAVVRGESAEAVLGTPKAGGASHGAAAVQKEEKPGASPEPKAGPAPAPTTVTNQITDGPYGWQSKFEVTKTDTEYKVVIKPKLVPDAGVTAAQVADVKLRAKAAFTRMFDNKFVLTDTADKKQYNLRADVQFVDSGEHYTVKLHTGPDGNGNLGNWYTGNYDETLAHELGHQLGLKDEYVDATVPARATATSPGVHTDHSVMGNYLAEGRPDAAAQLRHGQTIGNEIGGATGRTFTIAKKP